MEGDAGRPGETTDLLGLPVELRECIYEHYLSGLKPATLTIAKYPSKSHWTLITSIHCRTPALLRTCRTISTEVMKVMSSKAAGGPDDQFPLSHGPKIRLEPRRIRPSLDDVNIEQSEQTVERIDVAAILTPVLSKGAPSMRLHLVMPQSPTDAMHFTYMLRFLVALCNARATPMSLVRAVRDPVSGPGWAADINAMAVDVGKTRCERLEWENWYRSWYGPSSNSAGGGRDVEKTARNKLEEMDVERAWQMVVESCHNW